MLHFMLDVPENEGNSRKLKKEQEIVQHFSEKYVDIMYQNKIYAFDKFDNLINLKV